MVNWVERGEQRAADWRSESMPCPPERVIVVDDSISADTAYRHACEGTAMLWRGDFHNARQLLLAMDRRIQRRPSKARKTREQGSAADAFHKHRLAQSQRARTLGMLLLAFDSGHVLNLRRAPDVRLACEEAFGKAAVPYVMSLRELQGAIGAHEWHKRGVEIAALNDRIHPCYGVFSPVRGEYLELVARAPLPSTSLAFDIGTGTGVLAAILARRGVASIVATDMDTRALACATHNIERLGLSGQVRVERHDLFPPGMAPLLVCNPPWIPARPSSSIEHAVYDQDSRMLLGFLNGLSAHLTSAGEGWLILSDIAEHLGLRSREALLHAIDKAGLTVRDRLDTRPHHGKSSDIDDPLHAARSREITSLWRLALR